MDSTKWTYKEFEIEENLKPGTAKFQYFFKVLKDGRKQCTYCVWMTDDAVKEKAGADARQDPYGTIVQIERSRWVDWVKHRLDVEMYDDLALKIMRDGEIEINLTQANDKVSF